MLSLLLLFTDQAKQKEALYLREHRGELIEELAKTIVQKVTQQSALSLTFFATRNDSYLKQAIRAHGFRWNLNNTLFKKIESFIQ